ncbi:hypothetical protein GW17_00049603 [Ensete ventricosum]|nr:hypothetical protein GW17_00049603 [Ensete ventricosum]
MSDLWAGSLEEHTVGKKPTEEHPAGKKPAEAVGKKLYPATKKPTEDTEKKSHPVRKKAEELLARQCVVELISLTWKGVNKRYELGTKQYKKSAISGFPIVVPPIADSGTTPSDGSTITVQVFWRLPTVVPPVPTIVSPLLEFSSKG